MVKVDISDRPARPAAVPSDARIRTDGNERREEREQKEEQRLSAASVDVVAVARDETEEISHFEQRIPVSGDSAFDR
jgi:hypothetical protein